MLYCKINKKLGFVITLAVIIISIAFIAFWRMNPERKVEHLLKRGEVSEVISYYNNNAKLSEKDRSEINVILVKHLDNTLAKWKKDENAFDQTIEIFKEFSEISNDIISENAQEKLEFVALEHKGNEAVKLAEEAYEKQNYIQVMKYANEIDASYSQYSVFQKLYDECKKILLEKAEKLQTVDEYKNAIQDLNTYIKETQDSSFIARKKELEEGLKEYQNIYDILSSATDLFEKGSYKDSFQILETGMMKYPDNNKIKYAASAYQYSYILNITEQATAYTEQEDYEDAVDLLENAVEIYDCEEFRELLNAAKMKSDRLYYVKTKFQDAGDYILKSAKKTVLGDFSEDEQETLLSLGGSVAASLTDMDVPLDVRDLTYDVMHWGEGDYFAARLALDAVGIFPIIGMIKYAKHLDNAGDIAKAAGKAVDTADAVHDAAKKADTVKNIDKIADKADVISDVKKKTEHVADLNDDLDGYADITKKTDQAADAAEETVNGYVKMETKNQKYENKLHPETGVRFIRRNLDLSDGRKISGVFPEFHSYANINLPPEYWKASFNDQKKYLADYLQEELQTPAEKEKLMKVFSKAELDDIAEGVIPEGYVWHHNEEEGRMQLVDAEIHEKTGHTGGMSIWGIGYDQGEK